MGKEKCSNCKKKFDYDTFYGICPKCGVYNRKLDMSVENEVLEFAFDRGKTKNSELEKKKIKSMNKGKMLLFAGLLIIVFASVIVYQVNRVKIVRLYNSPTYTTAYQVGQKIKLTGVTAVVLKARTMSFTEEQKIVPKNKKVIGVKMEYDLYSKPTNIAPPLLCTENETYQKNLYNWELQSNMDNAADNNDLGVLYAYDPLDCDINGYYYYLVDEDVTEVTILLQDVKEFRSKKYSKNNYLVKVVIDGRN